MRKLFSFIVAVTMIFTLCTSAFAADNEQEITFNEYYTALKAEYNKYNIGFEIENPNLNFTYTREFLNEQLEIARDFCENLTIKVSDDPQHSDSSQILKPRSMLAHYTWSKDYMITSNALNVPAGMDVRVTVSGETDMQNSQVLTRNASVKELDSVNLGANNLYVQTSVINGTKVYVSLRGSVRFSWTDPKTHSVHSTTVYEPFFGESFDPQNFIAG